MSTSAKSSTECCPPFDPAPWDDRIITWENKKFIKDKVCTIFYMPLNFGAAMRRLNKRVDNAGATVPDWLCLSDHTSKWNMDLFLAVDKEIPDTANIALSGKFYCKVYEGPFKDTGKWMQDAETRSSAKSLKIKKWYMWYTTCPKCAKKYGRNYVVVMGQI
jgi:hypothetical protein